MNTSTKFYGATFITLGDIPCPSNLGRPATSPAVNLSETSHGEGSIHYFDKFWHFDLLKKIGSFRECEESKYKRDGL
jgi:hypothetical protein